jgi:hypothetical protein
LHILAKIESTSGPSDCSSCIHSGVSPWPSSSR